jgi:limonene-1,2-epoxide hydrolase
MEGVMTNQEIISSFYSAFAAHNAEQMVSFYSDDVVFEDPAFGELHGERAKGMWRMLLSRAKGNLEVNFSEVKAEGETGSAHWVAQYAYGPSKRPVVNEIVAQFEFKDGKIVKHVDRFDLWKWSRMALGLPGVLLGWSSFIRSKVNKQANKSLDQFMAKQG